MEFYENKESTRLLHPVLDILNDTLYVTIRAMVKDKGAMNVVVDSNRNTYTTEEWHQGMKRAGIALRVDKVNVGLEERWSMGDLGAFTRGEATTPTWQEVYNEIYASLDDHLVLCNQDYLIILTLFVMMTYLHPIFDVLPLLWLHGPAESGKSRAAEVIAALAFNANISGGGTLSTLFRRAHEGRHTQIISEADHLAEMGSGDRLVQQLQAGCRESEACMDVSEKSKGRAFTPTTYYTFVPRVLLSTTPFKSHPLISRCIRLDILKVAHANEEKLNRSIKNSPDRWSFLRDTLYRLQLMCFRDALEMREKMARNWKGPKGRTRDKWFPLAVIAALVSEELLEAVTRMAMKNQKEQHQDAAFSFEGLIFNFARWLVREGDQEFNTNQMYNLFCNTEMQAENEAPLWADQTDTPVTNKLLRGWVKGKTALARDMKRLNLIPEQPRKGRDNNYYQMQKANIDALVAVYLGV